MTNDDTLGKAKGLFRQAGLPFPYIPIPLSQQLRELHSWCFSTRSLRLSPYALRNFVQEAATGAVDDYAVLAHDGHGINSYAIHYYLVYGLLHMFLQLGWGGAYSDRKRDTEIIKKCFAVGGELIAAVERGEDRGSICGRTRLTVVASDWHGSFWTNSGLIPHKFPAGAPLDILNEALASTDSSAG